MRYWLVALVVVSLAATLGCHSTSTKTPSSVSGGRPAESATSGSTGSAAAGQVAPSTLALRVGSTDTGSTHYAYAVAQAAFLSNNVEGVSLTVVTSGGGADNLERLRSREFDLATAVTNSIAYQGFHGIGDKTRDINHQPDLRWLWTYGVSSRAILVTKASKVTRLSDLDGKRISPGIRGSATEKDFMAHLEILGVKPEYHRGGTEDALAAVREKQIVGYVRAQPGNKLDASTAELKLSLPMRLIGYTDAQIEQISARRPWDLWVSLGQDELFEGAPPIKTLANTVGTVTLKGSLPDEAAYSMVKALNERGVEEIGHNMPFLRGWRLAEQTATTTRIPLHPGVLKYLRELGLTVQPHQIPPEAR